MGKTKHRITHKVVVGRLKRWFEAQGMVNIRDDIRGYFFYGSTDVAYQNLETGFVFACEVKPPYASTREIIRGIGQCALYLSSGLTLKPFLVISKDMYGGIFPIFEPLDWLGVIIYQGECFQMVKEPRGQILYTPKLKERKRRGRWKKEEPLPDF